MKYSNIIKRSFLPALVALAATACTEEVNYGNVEAPAFGDGELVYVTDAKGSTSAPSIEFRSSSSIELFANATKPMDSDKTVTFAYDLAALNSFNLANGTTFEAVPAEMVTLSGEGAITLAAGEVKSAPMTVSVSSDGTLDPEKTYAIPLSLTGDNVAASAANYLIFVTDLTALPDCYKTVLDADGNEVPAVKMFSCMEVNDTNPLNNLKYTLKNSGKYLFDALILFSSNVNIHPTTGEVYVFHNENVQALLDNREHYLVPLQRAGMKVYLSLLGNHDGSGIANLSEETAKKYAKEIKAQCDAYGLDGVFWDDEYSEYSKVDGVPGFVSPSRAACSRLIYEVWKLQPERDNIAYVYSTTSSLDEVDGVQAGTYCKYALHDYGGSYDLSSNYPGMPKSNMGLYSQEFAMGRIASLNNLNRLRADGYGCHMIFALDPNRSNVNSQHNSLSNCATAFYDDELVIDPTNYPQDWK